MSNSSIWPIDGNLSVLQFQDRLDLEVMAMKGYSAIANSITGTSQSDCLMSFLGHTLEECSCSTAEMRSVFSTPLNDWANNSICYYSYVSTNFNGFNYCYLTPIVFFQHLNCFKYFYVTPTIRFKHQSFVYTQWIGQALVWTIDGTLTSTTTRYQWQWRTSTHSPKLQNRSLTIVCSLVSCPEIRWEWVLPLCRDAVSVFYNPSWLAVLKNKVLPKTMDHLWNVICFWPFQGLLTFVICNMWLKMYLFVDKI